MPRVCPDLSHLQEQVQEVVNKTDDTGKEIALQVCDLEGDLVEGEVTQGDSKYRVKVNTKCKNGNLAGVIHTHPGGVPVPSKLDVEAARRNEWDFVCVAEEEGQHLGCYCFK